MSLKQDTALKNVVFQAAEEKPRFSWAETLTGISFPKTEFRIIRSTGEEPFDPAKIAESIGEAITDLEISRNNNDIFNEKKRTLRALGTKEVGNHLGLDRSHESPTKG